jgi:hypothetical protein
VVVPVGAFPENLQGEIQFCRSEEGDGGSTQWEPFQTMFSIQFIRIAATCQAQEKEEEKGGRKYK